MLKAFATGRDVPVDPALDANALYSKFRMRVIVAVTAGYALSYTCRLAINVVKKPLIDGGIFTPDQLGIIGSALFYSYAAGKLINGFVADHANPRLFFAIGLLVSAFCNFGMGLSNSFWLTILFWSVNGWFQSYGAPACVISLASWFSNRERGRFYGIWTTSHSIGEGMTFVLVSALAAALGWRWGFFGPALAVLATAVVIWWMFPDRPRTMGLPAVADFKDDHYAAIPPALSHLPESLFAAQLSILRYPTLWVVALASAAAYVSRYAINSWGILYLQEARGYSLAQAGSMMAASTVAGVVGAVAFGYVSDTLFGARRPPANLIFALIEILGLVLFFYGPQGTLWAVLALILFGLGMTGLVTSIGGLFAVDMCPKRVAGAALGMVGMFSYAGAAIQERVSGSLIEKGMTITGGVRHYDFGPAIQFWIGASIVSAILATTLWNAKLRD